MPQQLVGIIILAAWIVSFGLLQSPIAKAQPKRPPTSAEWGITAYQQGNDELALHYFQQAWRSQAQLVGLKVVDPTPLVWQAKCYARLGTMHQASKAINEATALAQPGSPAYAFATKALHELFPLPEAVGSSAVFHQQLGVAASPSIASPSSITTSSITMAHPPMMWHQPVMVWVQPTMPASLSPKQAQRLQVSPQEIENLVRQWQPALPNSIPMDVIQDATQATVRIEWVESLTPTALATNTQGFTSGLTQWQVKDNQLTGATIRIAVRGPKGQPRTKVALLQTTLHELGHALGLAEHSTITGDIMAAHGVGSYHVSPNDLARLQALYSSPDSAPTSTTLTVLP